MQMRILLMRLGSYGDNAMYYAESSYNALTDNENKDMEVGCGKFEWIYDNGSGCFTKLYANGSDAVTDIHFSNDGEFADRSRFFTTVMILLEI